MTSTDRHVIVGVDTHLDVHVAAVIDAATGQLLDTASFETRPGGYAALLAWARSYGMLDQIGVEATGSYGAGLTRFLTGEQITVIEVNRPDRQVRRLAGKTDPVDAEMAARAVLAGTATAIPKDRSGLVEAIRVLEMVYDSAIKSRARAINQFKNLLVTAPDTLRERLRHLSDHEMFGRARRLRCDIDDPAQAATRRALKELARRIEWLGQQADDVEQQLHELTAQAAPGLRGIHGVGPHVAAQLMAAAGANPDRFSSEAAFAKLAGVAPLPASSGKTTRHRLNRGGDRRANRALYTIVLVRMRHDARTRAYVARRTAEGKTRKEIIRCLKRYVAREVFIAITRPPTDVPTGTELRELRTHLGLSLTNVCNAIGTSPIDLSRLERGLTFDNDRARKTQTWLRTQTP